MVVGLSKSPRARNLDRQAIVENLIRWMLAMQTRCPEIRVIGCALEIVDRHAETAVGRTEFQTGFKDTRGAQSL
jgi:hypothetical protein